jgi:23S rRNA pseudouridine2604 synthase
MVRINKWFSEMGICSKKQADLLISAGRVTVNNLPAKLGMTIAEADTVLLDHQPVGDRPTPVVILYHKPVGVICTHRKDITKSIENVLKLDQRVFAIGRLDKDSEGLLILTNQGELVNKIMRSENKQKKVYKVWVDKDVTQNFVANMANGVEILGSKTLPCEVEKLSDDCFQITLVQGLNRQIRRMCKALGYKVLRLQRIQIMQFNLDGLEEGQFRYLDSTELQALYKNLEKSIN